MTIAVGYPKTTTDAQLNAAYEAESDRLWEELNAHNAAWNRMLDAVGYMNPGIEAIEKAIKQMLKAKDELEGLPAEYKLGSLIDSLEDLLCDFNGMRKDFIAGRG